MLHIRGPSGSGSLTCLDAPGLASKSPLATHIHPSAPVPLSRASHTNTPTTPSAISHLIGPSVLSSYPAPPTPPPAPLPCREPLSRRKGPGVPRILLPALPTPRGTPGLQDSAPSGTSGAYPPLHVPMAPTGPHSPTPSTQGHQLTLVQIPSCLQGHGDFCRKSEFSLIG